MPWEGRLKAIEKLSHSVLKAKVQHQRASRAMLSWKAPEKTYLRPFSVALCFSSSLYSPWTAILTTPLASPASLGPLHCISVTIFSSDKGVSHTVRARLHTFIRHDLLLIWFHLQNLLSSKGHIHSYLLWEVRGIQFNRWYCHAFLLLATSSSRINCFPLWKASLCTSITVLTISEAGTTHVSLGPWVNTISCSFSLGLTLSPSVFPGHELKCLMTTILQRSPSSEGRFRLQNPG